MRWCGDHVRGVPASHVPHRRSTRQQDRGSDRTSARYVFGRPLMTDSKVRRHSKAGAPRGNGNTASQVPAGDGGEDADLRAAGLPVLKRGSGDAASGEGSMAKARGAAAAYGDATDVVPVPRRRRASSNARATLHFQGVAPATTLDSSPIRNMADASRPVIGTTGANMATITMGSDHAPTRRRPEVQVRRGGSQRALDTGANSSVAVTLSLARQAARKSPGGASGGPRRHLGALGRSRSSVYA